MFERRSATSSSGMINWSQMWRSPFPERRWILPEHEVFLDVWVRAFGVSVCSRIIRNLLILGEVDYAAKARFRSLLLCGEHRSFHDQPEIVGTHEQRILNALCLWGRRESRRQIGASNYCICNCDLPYSRTRYYDRPITPRHPRLSLYQRHWKILQTSSSKQQLEPAILGGLRFPRGTQDG